MKRTLLSLVLVLALCSALLAGCTNDAPAASQLPREAILENLAHPVEMPVADSNQPTPQPEAAPTEPASAAPAVTPTACNVCADYDCNDGIYCDDWDDKAENLRELENIRNNTPCDVCGEYDCDDGIYCDDWDEKWENQLEQQNRQNGTPCNTCGEYDCDDGIYCDDWDDRYDHHHHGHK